MRELTVRFSCPVLSLQSTSATTPCITWVRLKQLGDTKHSKPELSIQVDDIIQMKKLGGLGWKSKLVLSDLLDVDLAGAIELTTNDGTKTTFTALPRRDALFNRLLALSHNVGLVYLTVDLKDDSNVDMLYLIVDLETFPTLTCSYRRGGSRARGSIGSHMRRVASQCMSLQ